MIRTYLCKSTTFTQIKSLTVALLLFLQAPAMFSQQRPPFSEKTIETESRIFLPFTKGEVVKKINGPQKPAFDEICSIITAWDSIAPPQGIKVDCNGFDNSLEIYFLPYLFEEGTRFASGGGPRLSIYVNDPLQMFSLPIVSDIFLCPQKTTDFYGYPIYQTDRGEVTIISKKKIPLFVPVSQEEYLKALIAKEEKDSKTNPGSDYQSAIREMEQAHQQLLKSDKQAAKEFKQSMDDFKAQLSKSGEGQSSYDAVAMLQKELSGLTASERTRQAWYSGASAIEAYQNLSGLVPYENRENAEALVRPNPALIDKASSGKIQLLVIRWSLGEYTNPDKPRLYNDGREGFNLANELMSQLYKNQSIWNNIFTICN